MTEHDEELITSHKATLLDHEKRLRDLEKASNERTVKLLNFDEKFAAILKAVENLAEKVDEMKDNFDSQLLQVESRINIKIDNLAKEFDERLKPLENADAEKWRRLVWLVIGAIVTTAAGYFIGVITKGHIE